MGFIQINVILSCVFFSLYSDTADVSLLSDTDSPCPDDPSKRRRRVRKSSARSQQSVSKKRKLMRNNEEDKLIIKSLKGIEERLTQKQEDEDYLFGMLVAANMRRLNNRQKAEAKLRIQQVLVDVEYPNERHNIPPQQHNLLT